MACHSSDLEIFPKLADHSKRLMKLEDYISFVFESTQYWHESKYMVKNEIREIFSALSSVLHQREMQLYRQVDELRLNLGSSALSISHENGSQQGKDSVKSLHMPRRKLFSGPCVSPPVKLKFKSDIKSLEEAINSFGCVEIEDGRISDDDNFIFVNPEDGLSVEDERNDLDQSVIEDKTEASSVGSSDSFEILPDSEASVPQSKKKSSNVDHVSLHRSNFEKSAVSNQAGSHSVISSSSCGSISIFPDSKAKNPVSWLKKDTNNNPNFSCTGSPNSLKSGGPFAVPSHPYTSNGNALWLKKPSETKSSAAVLSADDIACALPFTGAFKAKGSQASKEDFRSASVPENNRNSTEATRNSATSIVKNGNPYLAVNVPNSNPVPDFSSMISKMIGKGNDGWLGGNHSNVIQPFSCHDYNKAVTDTVKQRNARCLDRMPFEAEAMPTDVTNTEESNSPTLTINKMFSPYFKNHDKSNWLVKNHVNNKMCIYS